MAAALHGENSRAVEAATIESSLIGLFVLATGDEDLGRLMAYIIAVCFFGAVGMAVPRTHLQNVAACPPLEQIVNFLAFWTISKLKHVFAVF